MNLITSQYSQSFSPGVFRTPDIATSILTPKVSTYQLHEKFKSLLSEGSKSTYLHTPLHFFSWIPFQHVQMNFGILQSLGSKANYSRWGQTFSLQNTLHYPFFQRLFQNLIGGSSFSKNPIQTLKTSTPDESIQTQLQQKILNPEPETIHRLQQINSDRNKKGLPPIDFKSSTQQIESIMNNPSLSDKEKKKQIGSLRKQLGLSKKDMKALFTQRLKKIYESAAQQIKLQIQNTTDPIEKQRLTQRLQQYESKASLYNSMFKSIWSKLGGVFKKIGSVFKKVVSGIFKVVKFLSPLLKFIPGIGQIASLATDLFGKAFNFLKDKISKVTKPIQDFLGDSMNPVIQPWLDQGKKYLKSFIQI